jgi:hypothetical protein
MTDRGTQVHDDDNAGLSAADLFELNRDLQGSRAIRLLATTNLSLYATLMERHLNDGAVTETGSSCGSNATSQISVTRSKGSRLSSPGPARAGCTASSTNATTPTFATSPRTPAVRWTS